MSKKKKSKKTTTAEVDGDPDIDLDFWHQTILAGTLPNVGSEVERRHMIMHVNLTYRLACELRAVRRAIEAKT